MEITQFIVDAFTEEVFKGNPAAICVLKEWLPAQLMKKIALENNLSETAFVTGGNGTYQLRWFTPEREIDLCGHATLATSYVVMSFLEPERTSVVFQTKSGLLAIRRQADQFYMELPEYPIRKTEITPEMVKATGQHLLDAFLGRDLVCVLPSEEDVIHFQPNLENIKQLPGLLFHITAQGSNYDCVSRTFAPKCGIPEDPVCGSGHCHIIPYWSDKTGKRELRAYQASSRGGVLHCLRKDGKIIIGGKCVLFSRSRLFIEDRIIQTNVK